MFKKSLILLLISSNIFAYTYNIYFNFNLESNNNIQIRYNKIIDDIFNIVNKYNKKNNSKHCKFKLDDKNIKITCLELNKSTIPDLNNYVSNNILNKGELFSYKIVRRDKEITSIIKKKSEEYFNKFKSFFKK